MSKENLEKALKVLDTTQRLLIPGSGLIQILVAATMKAVTKSEEVTESGKVDEIRAEAERQEASLRMAEGQTRVAQEIAIARRIEFAEEVEMEEYYDYSGEGHAGFKTDGATVGMGLGGSGKRVSRRVYRFRGVCENKPEVSQGVLPEQGTS